MNAQTLLEELREREVVFEADGGGLCVDAPAGLITDELRASLARHKPQLLQLLQRERRKLEVADRRGLVVKWGRERGWIALHDPTTGEWHEVRASACLPGIVEAANATRRRGRVF